MSPTPDPEPDPATRPASTPVETAVRRSANEFGRKYAGLVIGAFRGDETAAAGIGRARPGGDPPTSREVFEIGSVSKVFTALLLADAVVREEVELETTLSTEFPDVPSHSSGTRVTFEHLASHTSGLPRLPPGLIREAWRHRSDPYRHVDAALLESSLRRTRLKSEPGTKVRYSNFGAGVLGEALARLTGTSYADLVSDRIARPLRLRDTVLRVREDQLDRHVTGHTRRGVETVDWDLAALAGAGGLHSTVDDLLAFLRVQLDPARTPLAAAIALTHEPRAKANRWLTVCLGWHRAPLRGVTGDILWHNGGTGGTYSYVGLARESRCGVVVLANTARPVDAIGARVLQRLEAPAP